MVHSILKAITLAVAIGILTIPKTSLGADFVIYSVYKPIDLGNLGETPQKDFYVNMGTTNGIVNGSTLEVLRKAPTFDLLAEKLYKDLTFPIARLKVIHVEANAAIARLEKMLPSDKTPTTTFHSVMVGDLVRIAE